MSVVYGYHLFFGHIKSNTLEITDFNRITTDTLHPKFNKFYISHNVNIKGTINGNIRVRLNNSYPWEISGKVDTLFNLEYYGNFPAILEIESSNLATGLLTVKHRIE